MKNIRLRNFLQLILNILCLGAVLYGSLIALSTFGFDKVDTYRLFYLDGGFFTGVFIAICAFFGIILNIIRICKNKNIKCSPLYFLSFSTAVLAIGSIAFNGAYGFLHSVDTLYGLDLTILKTFNFQNVCLYFIAPSVFAFSFLFLSTEKERKIGHVFDGPVLTIIFVLYSIIFASVNHIIPDYYAMFDVNQFLPERWYLILTIFIVLMIGPFIAGLIMYSINNKISAKVVSEIDPDANKVEPIFISEEPKAEEAPIAEEPKIEVEPEIEEDINAPKKKSSKKKSSTKEKKNDSKASKKEKKASAKKEEPQNDLPRVYHVSKRSEDNMWQVKFANGKRAVKLFKTQAEAMEYAKSLANSNGGSIRVHSLKGKIRKA